ncbi:hypothetical protein [Lentzea sp. NPDC051838]|uniref:hypothetical protein n=1 Tax=Lentzea sp. NPDC051838 TaxID=3154849 RepID=UPI0034259C32
MRAGAAAGGAAGAPAGGVTKFSVDPDQAQKMIDGLNLAIQKLVDLEKKSGQLKLAGAPGPDPVSEQAKTSMTKTAGENPGGYQWANREARKALEQTVKNIEKALAKYRGTDDAAHAALKG